MRTTMAAFEQRPSSRGAVATPASAGENHLTEQGKASGEAAAAVRGGGGGAGVCRLSRSTRQALRTPAVLFAVWVLLSISVSLKNMQMENKARRATAAAAAVSKVDAANMIATTTTTTATTADDATRATYTVSNGPQLVQAPSDNIKYQNMDAMCTLKRYSHLFEKFCDPDTGDQSSSCNLEAFKEYFTKHNAEENLVGGCPLHEAVCYAKRYPDLLEGYCKGIESNCKYYSLRDHYEQHGIGERRTWGCEM